MAPSEHPTPPGSPPLAFPTEEAARQIGIGRTTAFAEIRSGRLRSFRVGHKRLVPASAVNEYIADRMAEADGDAP